MDVDQMGTEALRAHAKHLQEQLEYYQRAHRNCMLGRRQQHYALKRDQYNQSSEVARGKEPRGSGAQRSRGVLRSVLPANATCTNASLIRQTSRRFHGTPCVPAQSFACVNGSLRVSHGCRGLFRCQQDGPAFACGHISSKVSRCACPIATIANRPKQSRKSSQAAAPPAARPALDAVDVTDALAAEETAKAMFADISRGLERDYNSAVESSSKGKGKGKGKAKAKTKANGRPETDELQLTIHEMVRRSTRLEDEWRREELQQVKKQERERKSREKQQLRLANSTRL